MASYWKSNPKKYCEYCSCWITDNKASIEFHERGKKHQEKKERKIAEIRKRSQTQYKNDQNAVEYLQKMEIAAIEQYKKDLQAQGIKLVGKYAHTPKEEKSINVPPPVDDPRPRGSQRKTRIAVIEPRILPRPSAWKEQKSPEGYVYYWNTENGKTTWEKPLGFVSKSDYEPEKPESTSKHGHSKNDDSDKNITESSSNNDDLTKNENDSSKIKDDSLKKSAESVKKPCTSQSDENPSKFRRIDPYGSWSVINNNPQKSNKPEKPKAPELLYKPIKSLPKTELDEEEPKIRNFQEKVIKNIDDSEGPSVFKKKSSKQRNIRKRT